MGWSQVSPTRWECHLMGIEDYFTFTAEVSANLFAGRQHYIFSSIFKLAIDLPDPESALKQAWKQLRYEQPQIAATTEAYKKIYEVPDTESALQSWVDETFIVSPFDTAEELSQTAPAINQATLYYLPTSSELVSTCTTRLMTGSFNALTNPSPSPGLGH